jgi:hypothetical protein
MVLFNSVLEQQSGGKPGYMKVGFSLSVGVLGRASAFVMFFTKQRV